MHHHVTRIADTRVFSLGVKARHLLMKRLVVAPPIRLATVQHPAISQGKMWRTDDLDVPQAWAVFAVDAPALSKACRLAFMVGLHEQSRYDLRADFGVIFASAQQTYALSITAYEAQKAGRVVLYGWQTGINVFGK